MGKGSQWTLGIELKYIYFLNNFNTIFLCEIKSFSCKKIINLPLFNLQKIGRHKSPAIWIHYIIQYAAFLALYTFSYFTRWQHLWQFPSRRVKTGIHYMFKFYRWPLRLTSSTSRLNWIKIEITCGGQSFAHVVIISVYQRDFSVTGHDELGRWVVTSQTRNEMDRVLCLVHFI